MCPRTTDLGLDGIVCIGGGGRRRVCCFTEWLRPTNGLSAATFSGNQRPEHVRERREGEERPDDEREHYEGHIATAPPIAIIAPPIQTHETSGLNAIRICARSPMTPVITT